MKERGLRQSVAQRCYLKFKTKCTFIFYFHEISIHVHLVFYRQNVPKYTDVKFSRMNINKI
jgi:hypothetical protein